MTAGDFGCRLPCSERGDWGQLMLAISCRGWGSVGGCCWVSVTCFEKNGRMICIRHWKLFIENFIVCCIRRGNFHSWFSVWFKLNITRIIFSNNSLNVSIEISKLSFIILRMTNVIKVSQLVLNCFLSLNLWYESFYSVAKFQIELKETIWYELRFYWFQYEETVVEFSRMKPPFGSFHSLKKFEKLLGNFSQIYECMLYKSKSVQISTLIERNHFLICQ